LALLNDFSVVFKVFNTVRTDSDPFPLGKPDLGAITVSLDSSQREISRRNSKQLLRKQQIILRGYTFCRIW